MLSYRSVTGDPAGWVSGGLVGATCFGEGFRAIEACCKMWPFIVCALDRGLRHQGFVRVFAHNLLFYSVCLGKRCERHHSFCDMSNTFAPFLMMPFVFALENSKSLIAQRLQKAQAAVATPWASGPANQRRLTCIVGGVRGGTARICLPLGFS